MLFTILALFFTPTWLGRTLLHRRRTELSMAFHAERSISYSIARTWHIQSILVLDCDGILCAGFFLAPIINGGKDPKFQKLGVDILFRHSLCW